MAHTYAHLPPNTAHACARLTRSVRTLLTTGLVGRRSSCSRRTLYPQRRSPSSLPAPLGLWARGVRGGSAGQGTGGGGRGGRALLHSPPHCAGRRPPVFSLGQPTPMCPVCLRHRHLPTPRWGMGHRNVGVNPATRGSHWVALCRTLREPRSRLATQWPRSVMRQFKGASHKWDWASTRRNVTPAPNSPCPGLASRGRHDDQSGGPHRGRFRTARAQRAHSANYYGDYPGNNPENHPPAESCTINSELKNSNI